MRSLRIGLVLDEEDLRLAGHRGCGRGDIVDLQLVVLLAEHIDDGLLLLGSIFGGQPDIGIARRWGLDEHHTVVLLRASNHQMLGTLQILMLFGSGDGEELLVDDGLLEATLDLLLLLLLVGGCLVAGQNAESNVGRGSETLRAIFTYLRCST